MIFHESWNSLGLRKMWPVSIWKCVHDVWLTASMAQRWKGLGNNHSIVILQNSLLPMLSDIRPYSVSVHWTVFVFLPTRRCLSLTCCSFLFFHPRPNYRSTILYILSLRSVWKHSNPSTDTFKNLHITTHLLLFQRSNCSVVSLLSKRHTDRQELLYIGPLGLSTFYSIW